MVALIVLLVVFGGIFYFMLIRPSGNGSREQKEGGKKTPESSKANQSRESNPGENPGSEERESGVASPKQPTAGSSGKKERELYLNEVMEEKGFRPLSYTVYGIPATVFWSSEKKFEIQAIKSGPTYLLKGMKRYYVQGSSEDGRETWDRSLGKLMDRIKNSFPEYHLYAAGISEVTEDLIPAEELEEIKREIKEKEEEIEEAEKQVEEGQNRGVLEKNLEKREQKIEYLRKVEEAAEKARGEGKVELDLTNLPFTDRWYLKFSIPTEGKPSEIAGKAARKRKAHQKKAERLEEKVREGEKEVEQLEEVIEMNREEIAELEEKMQKQKKFIEEYSRKGTVNCYMFGCSTPLMVASEDNLAQVVEEVIEDIETKHAHGSFTQSVEKGLKVNIKEVDLPWIAHQAEFVGLASPAQAEELSRLADEIKPFFWTTVEEDLKVERRVKERGKRTPARVMKAFLDRVGEVSKEEEIEISDVPKSGGWLGNLMKGDKVTDTPFLFDLDKLNHGYLSGTTGSGKTYTARALVENAIVADANVVVLDTTRQWCGLAKPASGVEDRFDRLGVDRDLTTGFPVDIYTPNSEAGKELPSALSELAKGLSVVTLKGLYDSERCEIARDILSEIYMSMEEESEGLETLVVIEEAHTFLPGNVDQSAKDVAKECGKRIERISREARKYGLNLLLLSQSLSDFKRSSKTVREMMNSKFFMRATDRSEIGYVEDYVSKEAAGWVKNLDIGEVLVNAPGIGPAKVYVRPPFSQLGELSDLEIEKVNRSEAEETGPGKEEFLDKVATLSENKSSSMELTEEEETLLKVAERYLEEEGEPIYISKVQDELDIKSKKKLQEMIDGLEERGLIETKKLKKRGSPRGIIPQ